MKSVIEMLREREILQARTSPGSADSFSYDSADAVELVVRWWHCSADLFKNKNNRYLILKHLIKCNCTIQSIKFCAYEHALVELPANWMTCNRSNKQSNANQSKKWYTVAFLWTANSHYWQTLHKHKKIKNICLKTMVSTHLKQRDWLLLSESHLSIYLSATSVRFPFPSQVLKHLQGKEEIIWHISHIAISKCTPLPPPKKKNIWQNEQQLHGS